jgi:hypothetical protein
MRALIEPTEDQRRTVRAMSGFGIPHDDIATLLEIDPKTLRKHFRRELDRGSIEATARPLQDLPDAELDRLLHDELAQYFQQRLGIDGSEAEEAEDNRPASQWRGARG